MTTASKKRRTPGGRKATAGAGQWEAFATPPVGSNLAAAVDALKALAAGPPLTDAELRRAVVRGLERSGMPKAPRPQWLEELIDNRLALVRAGINHMEFTVLANDSPHSLAMAIGVEAFWESFTARPGVPLSELFTDVATTLGPGVGASEVRRLIAWAIPRMADPSFLTAIAALNDQVELPHVTLTISRHEFYVVAGLIDELREPSVTR